MLLARESVRVLYFMSKGFAGAFMRPELTDRLCSMLNYFLAQLAGPQSVDLKVNLSLPVTSLHWPFPFPSFTTLSLPAPPFHPLPLSFLYSTIPFAFPC